MTSHAVKTVGWSLASIIAFLLVGVMYWFAFQLSPFLVPALILLALLGAVYLGLGGRAVFLRREHPDRILAARVRLTEIDGVGPTPPTVVEGIVQSFDGGFYRIAFAESVEIAGRTEHSATVSARHLEYPVSAASGHGILAVNGKLESGQGFIALLARAKAEPKAAPDAGHGGIPS
jgi:hypothetical protein